jgi:hypothetical protein
MGYLYLPGMTRPRQENFQRSFYVSHHVRRDEFPHAQRKIYHEDAAPSSKVRHFRATSD